MMVKLLITALSFLLVFPNAYAGSISCPASIVCDGDTGTCNNSAAWFLDTSYATEFSGQQEMQISEITAYKLNAGTPVTYQFKCTYNYSHQTEEQHSSIAIYRYVQKLEGNWRYSGFGKQQATCQSINPASCTATL